MCFPCLYSLPEYKYQMRLKLDHTSFACMYVSMRVRLMTARKLHYKLKKNNKEPSQITV